MRGSRDGGLDGGNSGPPERLPQLLTREWTAMSTGAPSVAGDYLGRRGGNAAVTSGTEPLHVRYTTLALTLSRFRSKPVDRELFSAMATLGNRIRASVCPIPQQEQRPDLPGVHAATRLPSASPFIVCTGVGARGRSFEVGPSAKQRNSMIAT